VLDERDVTSTSVWRLPSACSPALPPPTPSAVPGSAAASGATITVAQLTCCGAQHLTVVNWLAPAQAPRSEGRCALRRHGRGLT